MSNKKYFEDKLEEVSNTYMSADGANPPTTKKLNFGRSFIMGLILLGGVAFLLNNALNKGKGIN